jgi:hypothetical protein
MVGGMSLLDAKQGVNGGNGKTGLGEKALLAKRFAKAT